MAHVECIENNRTTLLRCITVNDLIVASLRAEGVVNDVKESILEAEKAHQHKVGLLIDWLKESAETVYESFLQVMENNEQKHVANLLRGIKEDSHVPLSLDRHNRLLQNRPKLMYMIHNNTGLIAALRSSRAISQTDVEDLSVKKVSNYKRNYKLINAILRRSDYSFEGLYRALSDTHQTSAADYLNEGEVIPVHVNTTRPDLDKHIAESINVTSVNESMDETAVKEIQMPNGLHIVGSTYGHSIVIFIYCKTIDNVVTFTQVFNSGELQTKLEDILNRLFARIEPKSTQRLKSSIRLDDADILEIEEITGIEDWMKLEKTNLLQSGRLLESQKIAEADEKATSEVLSASEFTISHGSGTPPERRHEETELVVYVKERLTLDVLKGLEIQITHGNLQTLLDFFAEQIFDFAQQIHVFDRKSLKGPILASHELSNEKQEKTTEILSVAAASRKLYWKQEKRGFYQMFDSLLTEEEELLKFFHSETASAEQDHTWKHRCCMLSDGLENLLETQTDIIRYLSRRRVLSEDELKRIYRNLQTTLKQQRHQWRHLKHLVLDERSTQPPTLWTPSFNKTDLQLQNVRHLKLNLKAAKEKSDEGDLFLALENLHRKEIILEETKENQMESFDCELPDKYSSDPVFVRAIETKDAEEKSKSVSGLTILDNELFVVSEKSSEVKVYDSTKFSFSRRWKMKDLIRPIDIGSCSRNKCLYILQIKGIFRWSNEILRVDRYGILINKWSTRGDVGYGLSVTDESNVILTVANKNKLNKYSPDGQLIREIDITSGAGIRCLLHAIELANGHFVVSHGYGDLHRVCTVSADGKPQKSFGENRGSAIGQMNEPFYLSVDVNGFVMVVDRRNSRVLLLDPDLEFKREILSKEEHGLRDPSRILLDGIKDRLFVADNEWNDGRILIFQLGLK